MKQLPPIVIISHSTAWYSMPRDLQSVSSTFLNMKMSVSIGGADVNVAEISYAKGILLANGTHQVEIQLAMATDKNSAENLARHMFGEISSDLGGDLLGELVNVSMGGLRTSFARESYPFTGGLPESFAPERFNQFGATSKRHMTFSLLVEGITIAVRICIGFKANAMVPVGSLCEGMFVAKDVLTAQGMVYVKEGTRLTSTMVDRLRVAFEHECPVEVALGATW